MQNTLKNFMFTTLSSTLVLMLAFAVTFSHATTAEASSTTYVIDTTGNGCGNGCAELYAYLDTLNTNTNASSTTNTNTTNNTGTSGNGSTSDGSTGTGSSTGTGNQGYTYGDTYVQYPYQIYSYWQKATSSTPATDPTTYKQSPYQIYNTYPPRATTPMYSTYPQPIYVSYGKSASSQVDAYKQSVGYSTYNPYSTSYYGSTSSGYGNGYGSSYGSSGFTLTSVIK